MSEEDELLRMAERAARACMNYPFAVWHFGDSVYVDALVALADESGASSGEFRAFAHGMVKGWIAHTSYDFVDHTAPGAAMIELWQRTGDRYLLDAAVRLADLWERFPRAATAEAYLHAFQRHLNVSIDCAHFDGPYFARLAAATNDERYAERAVYELLWRLRLLQDEHSGLCHHAFHTGRGRTTGVRWGRGQGWALLGLVETLRSLPHHIGGTEELLQRLTALVRGLVALQDTSGHWHTVVDDAASYLESSVAAFFVAAVSSAVANDLLPAGHVNAALCAAWRAVRAAVRRDGVLNGVSADTPSTISAQQYRSVPMGGPYPWGQGPLILAALSMIDNETEGQHANR